MAKKCIIYRDKKRRRMIKNAYDKRESLKKQIKDPNVSMDQKIESMKKLNDQPKNKSVARYKNRCEHCGRPRGYLRKFGLCRICLRIAMMKGLVPGLKKSSW